MTRPRPSASLAAREDQGRRDGIAIPAATVAPPFSPAKPERHAEGNGARPEGRRRPAFLPCLFSNNCTETEGVRGLRLLSAQHRKSACALAWNVQSLADRYGLCSLGFLTLTFADHVVSPCEAQRRFHSLSTHVLRSRYRAFVRVLERQKSGRIHYHLLVVMPVSVDIRSGCDFARFSLGEYSSASPALRSEWAFWRQTAKKYGFGRTELLPVKSNAEGIARYVGKYISKHVFKREEQDRGVRLVEYSRGARMATTKFAWTTSNAGAWRRKVELFALIVAAQRRRESVSFSDLSGLLGKSWAHKHRSFIAGLPDPLWGASGESEGEQNCSPEAVNC